VVVSVVFAHALPGWAVVVAQAPRCRRGKGGVLWRSSGVVRSACSVNSIRGFLPSTDCPPLPQRELGSPGRRLRPTATDCWFDPAGYGSVTIYQLPLDVVVGPSFLVRAGWCRPIGVELISS